MGRCTQAAAETRPTKLHFLQPRVAREFEGSVAEVFVIEHEPLLCRIRTRARSLCPIPFAFFHFPFFLFLKSVH